MAESWESRGAVDQPIHGLRGALARARLVVPLLLVNAMAVTGQVGYGLDHLAAPGTAWPLRVALALLFAAALESIGLYVGWHAHTALLTGATASAARLRMSSYTIATVVAGINYAHYAGPGGLPTAAAVAYGLVSLLSPWLWGLHSRRERHAALERSGLVDTSGARFSAERWRAFPVRTRSARRWSIAHGVTDPRAAWEGYHAERDARRAATTRRWRIRSERVAVAPPGVGPATGGATGSDTDTRTVALPGSGRAALRGATRGAGRSAAGAGRPAPRVATVAASGGARRMRTGERDEQGTGGAAGKVSVMRAYWDRETASGRVPTGAELARAGDAAKSLGRRKAAEWRQHLPAHLATGVGDTDLRGAWSGDTDTETAPSVEHQDVDATAEEPDDDTDDTATVTSGDTDTDTGAGLRLALVSEPANDTDQVVEHRNGSPMAVGGER